jgi:predicted AlkP superfamily phosphohydrolase/phosphomutase
MNARRTLAFGVVAVCLLACGDAAVQKGRVLLVGIDGATLRVINRLTARDRLPHLQSIAREGVHGPLQSHFPLWSPRIWNSIATGKSPDKHGILGFVRERKLYRSTDRKVHALWNIASDAGLIVGVVNWWNSYPPELVNGVIVSDHVFPRVNESRRMAYQATPSDDAAPLVHPAAWKVRTDEILAETVNPTTVQNFFEGNEAMPPWVKADKLSTAFVDDGRVTRLALAVEAELRPDLLMVFLPGIDRASHWLWGNLEPAELYPERLRPEPSQRKAGAAALHSYYEYTDALIGTLLARYGPDDLVMIVSDHGFESGVQFAQLTGQHETAKASKGIFYARGPGFPAGGRMQGVSVNDVTPTVLAWLGLPLGDDMDGVPVPAAIRGTPRTVSTHDTGPVEHLAGDATGAEEEMLQNLRELGYIE